MVEAGQHHRLRWLDPQVTNSGDVRGVLAKVPEPRLQPYEVSTAVNNPRNNGPDLVTPV